VCVGVKARDISREVKKRHQQEYFFFGWSLLSEAQIDLCDVLRKRNKSDSSQKVRGTGKMENYSTTF